MLQQLSKQYGSSYRYYYNQGCGNSESSSLAVLTGIIIIEGVVTVKQQSGSSYRYYYNLGCCNSKVSSMAVLTGIIVNQKVWQPEATSMAVLTGIIIIQGVATVKQVVWQFIQVLL